MDKSIVFTYADGSCLRVSTAQDFLKIPVWKGNRHIDLERVRLLTKEVKDNIQWLDSGYHVILQEEDVDGKTLHQRYIINGQHRRAVIEEYFATGLCLKNFPLTYTEMVVRSESEAIAYFNRINNMKPFHVDEDSKCVANRFIGTLEKEFCGKTKKDQFIRSYATKRPYLSTIHLRDELEKYSKTLQSVDTGLFVNAVKVWNANRLKEMELDVEKDYTSYIDKKFTLAEHTKLPWIQSILKDMKLL